jgi:hypothetical protein
MQCLLGYVHVSVASLVCIEKPATTKQQPQVWLAWPQCMWRGVHQEVVFVDDMP